MDLRLKDRRALVTGSSVGIGEAIARVLAREGASVAVHGRELARVQAVAEDIIAAGGQAVAVIGDITNDEAVRALTHEAAHLLGGIDILVNNAGGAAEKHSWQDTASDDWAAAFDRNVLAAVRVTRALLPSMRSCGWGRVVNISSLAGMMPPASGPDYSACKAALNSATTSLAREVAAEGVTVNAISPGTIFTPKLEERFRELAIAQSWGDGEASWPEVEAAVLPHIASVPAGRVGQADDIANAAAFLCSDLAGYINGVNLRVDGGAFPGL